MPLTDIACKTLKAKPKPYKASDTGGLYLQITPSGRKYWRMNYRYAEKYKTLAIGVYPDVTLKEARQKRDEAKRLLSEGKDPSTEKQRQRLKQQQSGEDRFSVLAEEWLEQRKEVLSSNHYRQLESMLQRDIYPVIGRIPIADITAADVLVALRKIEARGALDMARKARQCCGQIFRYAIALGKAERDVTADLKGALKTRRVEHRAYLKEADLPEFFQKLSDYDGDPLTALALELMVLTFVRTKELRGATWAEIDLENAVWSIPASRMKMHRPHMVPLSIQALSRLESIHELTGGREHVFPNSRTPAKPMSENTLLYAMYRMGYHSRATVHGFRATASTLLHEQGVRSELIELQLAHAERNQVKAAYNHALHLSARAEMMQGWADYLDRYR